MKIINYFLFFIFCFSSCVNSQGLESKKKILVTHEMIKDFIFWIAGDEYEVISIYDENQDPFRDAPVQIEEKDFISFFTMCQKWEKKAVRVASDKRPKSFITMKEPRVDIDCSSGSPWLHGAYLTEYLYETASSLAQINPFKTEDYFKQAESLSEQLNDFTINMRVLKMPDLKLPEGLRVAVYSSFGYEFLGYMSTAPYMKFVTMPSDLVFPSDLQNLKEDNFPPELIVFTSYADQNVIKMFEDNGFATVVINLFPSDFREDITPVQFIEKNYRKVRSAMLDLVDSLPPS